MANDDKPPKNRTREANGKAPVAKDRPFDMWLQKQLHAMYDEIAAEPLPEELVNMIQLDSDKTKKK